VTASILAPITGSESVIFQSSAGLLSGSAAGFQQLAGVFVGAVVILRRPMSSQ